MVAVVDEDLCIGCETCIDSCTSEAISMNSDKAKVDKTKCTDCETCVDICPSTAIHMG